MTETSEIDQIQRPGFPVQRLVGLLRHEAETHQTVFDSDRRRKILFAEAATALENACKRAEFWKAEHLAGNAEIARLLAAGGD